MKLRDAIQKAVDAASSPEMLALRFEDEGTFVLTQNGREHEYFCQFAILDPVKQNAQQIAAAQAIAAGQQDASFTDIRELRVHPDFDEPPEGATLRGGWDGGQLEVVSVSQESRFTKRCKIYCLLRR